MDECGHAWSLVMADAGQAVWRCEWCYAEVVATPDFVARSVAQAASLPDSGNSPSGSKTATEGDKGGEV